MKQVQTYPPESVMGGFQGAQIVHFICTWTVVVFVWVQIAPVALVPSTLKAMVTTRAEHQEFPK